MNNTSLLRSAAVVAFLASVLVPFTASARGETTTIDREATADLAEIGSAMGGRDGKVRVFDGLTVAVDGRAYITGALVSTTPRFELCEETSGRLHGCLPLAPAPGSTAYDCGKSTASGDTICECKGAVDCIQMTLIDGACDGALSCTGDSCTCDF